MTATFQAIAPQDIVTHALASSHAGRAISPGGSPAQLLADMLPLTDGTAVVGASAAACLLHTGIEKMGPGIPAITLLAAILCVNILRVGGAYRELLRDSMAMRITRVARAWCWVAMGLVLLGYLTKSSESISQA